ncbi:MAG: hypothetical protein NT079_05895 [Candidatus Omnitrophica bacterium]|nr:hypothetical protein [Candidatus Omnitrophota bacterium]
MTDFKETRKEGRKILWSSATKDLITIGMCVLFIFVLSYVFNVFGFFVTLFQKNPEAIKSIDEIIVVLLVLSIGFAIFSWRRWKELEQETNRRLKLQEELLKHAETKAETERIISKQLRSEIEERKRIAKKYFNV